MVSEKSNNAWSWVYEIVRLVPPGHVVTYGAISKALDGRLSSLAVGWALRVCPEDVPWHRVVNAKGQFSTDEKQPGLQGRHLTAEGIQLSAEGGVDLARYAWPIPTE